MCTYGVHYKPNHWKRKLKKPEGLSQATDLRKQTHACTAEDRARDVAMPGEHCSNGISGLCSFPLPTLPCFVQDTRLPISIIYMSTSSLQQPYMFTLLDALGGSLRSCAIVHLNIVIKNPNTIRILDPVFFFVEISSAKYYVCVFIVSGYACPASPWFSA